MSEAKTIELTIGERLAATKIFDTFKGSLTTLAVLLEDVKAFAVTDEEWGAANLVKTPNPDGTSNWKWEDTGKKEISVQKETVEFLKNAIKAKNDAGEITIADVALIGLDKVL